MPRALVNNDIKCQSAYVIKSSGKISLFLFSSFFSDIQHVLNKKKKGLLSKRGKDHSTQTTSRKTSIGMITLQSKSHPCIEYKSRKRSHLLILELPL